MDDIQRAGVSERAAAGAGWRRSRGWPTPGRAYTPEWEEAHWSLAAVAAHLAGYAVPAAGGRVGDGLVIQPGSLRGCHS